MPGLTEELSRLVAIPSVSVPGRLDEPLLEAHDIVSRLFADAGVDVGRLDLPDTAPVVVGRIEAPPGAPTVLLYSHYDVAAGGDETLWDSPPFEPSLRDGAIFGRGTTALRGMANVVVEVRTLESGKHSGQ
ncbi:MAG: M20/M25/M40 family metallo-hydrolase [Actinobacteria bacterium]|nr:MAG: M20/M25/M40 family metallo-hydrolase [Actinomycetota bacterium]